MLSHITTACDPLYCFKESQHRSLSNPHRPRPVRSPHKAPGRPTCWYDFISEGTTCYCWCFFFSFFQFYFFAHTQCNDSFQEAFTVESYEFISYHEGLPFHLQILHVLDLESAFNSVWIQITSFYFLPLGGRLTNKHLILTHKLTGEQVFAGEKISGKRFVKEWEKGPKDL